MEVMVGTDGATEDMVAAMEEDMEATVDMDAVTVDTVAMAVMDGANKTKFEPYPFYII